MTQSLSSVSRSLELWVIVTKKVSIWWKSNLCAKIKIVNTRYKCLVRNSSEPFKITGGGRYISSLKIIRSNLCLSSNLRLSRFFLEHGSSRVDCGIFSFLSTLGYNLFCQAYPGSESEDCFALWPLLPATQRLALTLVIVNLSCLLKPPLCS